MVMLRKFQWLKSFRSVTAAISLSVVTVAQAVESPRIVTVGSSVTELVYALGAGEQVVAVDVTSQQPLAVHQLPKVGYHRALSTEGVLSLRPDRVIGSDEMGPPPVIKQLQATQVNVDILTTDASVQNLYQRIEKTAALLNKPQEGSQLQAKIQHDIDAAKARFKGEKPRVLLLLSHNGTPMVAGAGTTADTLIQLAGGNNVAASHFERFRQVSDEAVLSMRPDLILITQSSHEAPDESRILAMQPGLAMTPAGISKRIVPVDGSLLVGGLGPRVGEAALALATEFYPES
ncbi:heme/hemin ABC transporter substrate-binding protein [Kistimonas asteriae]|uniref:heme/hemin ABC transporter substrate-binding protein n=1 Tax=Kistimonas asteriae TaxID=517724 RepID=UPI001BA88379|nr:ABC transporter substrate-binding protein [Kistimonas asteriae]